MLDTTTINQFSDEIDISNEIEPEKKIKMIGIKLKSSKNISKGDKRRL